MEGIFFLLSSFHVSLFGWLSWRTAPLWIFFVLSYTLSLSLSLPFGLLAFYIACSPLLLNGIKSHYLCEPLAGQSAR